MLLTPQLFQSRDQVFRTISQRGYCITQSNGARTWQRPQGIPCFPCLRNGSAPAHLSDIFCCLRCYAGFMIAPALVSSSLRCSTCTTTSELFRTQVKHTPSAAQYQVNTAHCSLCVMTYRLHLQGRLLLHRMFLADGKEGEQGHVDTARIYQRTRVRGQSILAMPSRR